MSQGLINACDGVEWQYFVTLTFGSSFSQKKTPNKIHRLHTWLRQVVAHHTDSRTLDDVRFLVREEHGEQGGRFHYHILIADLQAPTPTHCHAMAWVWREKMKVGYAVIRPYNSALSGVGYVLKGLSPSTLRHLRNSVDDKDARIHAAQIGTQSGRYSSKEANNYELSKYAKENLLLDSDAATPSHALNNWLWSRVSRSEKAKYRFKRMARRRLTKHTLRKSA